MWFQLEAQIEASQQADAGLCGFSTDVIKAFESPKRPAATGGESRGGA